MPKHVEVSWERFPESDMIISHYVIHHNFPKVDGSLETGSTRLLGSNSSITFKDVYPGAYYFSISAVGTNGLRSEPYIEYYDLVKEQDSGGSNHLVAPTGVPLGGQSNTSFREETINGITYLISDIQDWKIKSPHKQATSLENQSHLSTTIAQSVDNVSSICSRVASAFSSKNLNDVESFSEDVHYLYLDGKSSTDPLKLVKFNKNPIPYWYDTGDGSKTSIAGSSSSYVTALTGTISTRKNENTVYGRSTNFIEEVSQGDMLFITSGSAYVVGRVATVDGYNILKLEQTTPVARQYQSFGKANLTPDFINDSILAAYAKVENDSNLLHNYLTTDADKQDPLAVNQDSDTILARWSFDSMVDNKIPKNGSDPLNSFLAINSGSGTTVIEDSPSGNALNFTGSSKVRLQDDEASYIWSNAGGCFSIWLKSTKTDGTGLSDARILSRDSYWSLRLDQSSATNQNVTLINEQTSSAILVGTIESNKWNNIAMASVGDSPYYNYGLYINGKVTSVYSAGSSPWPVEGSAPSQGTYTTKSLTLAGKQDNTKNFVGAVTDLVIAKERLVPDSIRGLNAMSGIGSPSTTNTPVSIGEGSTNITVDAEGISVGASTPGDSPFSVAPSGSIVAVAGNVAGWTLSKSSIYSASVPVSSGYGDGISLNSNGSLHAKEFFIDTDGNANFKGTLTSSSGNIGGWNLNTSTLYAGDISSASAESLTSGYIQGLAEDEGALVLHNQGSLHSKNFFINSDGSASFKGDLDAATGTFAGQLAANTVDADAVDFGSIDADSIKVGTLRGSSLSASAEIAVFKTNNDGTIVSNSYAALTGKNDNVRLHVGNISPEASPFRVSASGSVTARDLRLYTDKNTLYFDSTTGGFTAAAMAQIAKVLELRTHSFREDWTADFDVTQTDTFELVTISETTTVNPMLQFTMRDFEHVSMPAVNIFSNPAESINGRILQTSISFSASIASRANDFTATRTISSFTIGKIGIGDVLHSTERPYFYKGEVGCIRFPAKNPDNESETLSGKNRRVKIASASGLEDMDGNSLVTGEQIRLATYKDDLIFFRTNSAGTCTLTIDKYEQPPQFAFLEDDSGDVNITLSIPVIDFDEQYYKDELLKHTPTKITGSILRSDGASDATPSTVAAKTIINNGYTDSRDIDDRFNYKYLTPSFDKIIADRSSSYTPQAVLQESVAYATYNNGYTRTVNVAHEVMLNRATQTLNPGVYYYHSTLSATMGSEVANSAAKKAVIDSSRIFTLDADRTKKGFQLNVNEASQSSVDAALQTLDLAGNINASDGMTIDLSSGSGTLNINGNLNVTGTQTATNQSDSVVSGKNITLSANATNVAQVNQAGIVIDRSKISTGALPDATILWDNTNSEWDIYEAVSANTFRAAVDGSSNSPAFTFGARTKTGLFAADANTGDRISIATNDGSNNAKLTSFDIDGVTTHADFTATGKFKGLTDWVATTGSSNKYFHFENSAGGKILTISTASSALGVGTTNPAGKLHIHNGSASVIDNNVSKLKDLIVESDGDTGLSIVSPNNKTSSLELGKGGRVDATQIIFDSSASETTFYHLGREKMLFDGSAGLPVKILSLGTGQVVTKSGGELQLQNKKSLIGSTAASSRFGAYLSFATNKINEDISLVRGAIRSGPASNSTRGYGYMDLLVNQLNSQDENLSASPALRVHSSLSGGNQLFFKATPVRNHEIPDTGIIAEFSGDAKSSMVNFKISGSAATVNNGSALILGVRNSVIQLNARRDASDNGAANFEIYTATGTGPNTDPAIYCKSVGNNVGIVQDDPKATLQVSQVGIETTTVTATGTNGTIIASYNTSDFISAKFMIQMEDTANNNHLVSELLCVYDPNTQTAHATEYGVIHTGSDKGVSFAVSVASGNVYLSATPTSTATGEGVTRRFTTCTTAIARQIG